MEAAVMNTGIQGKTVLVTGATGFLGQVLVHRLSQTGARVRALARRPNGAATIKDLPHVEIVLGDITRPNDMQRVMPNVDIVIHAAAAMGGSRLLQQRVNVTGTRHVALAAAQQGIARFVYISSIAVYGYRQTGILAETTPHNTGSVPYNITKSQAEAIVEDIAAVHDLPYTIVRPGMIYGAGADFWTRQMFKLATRKPTLFVGDGSTTVQPIHVDDVVDLIVQLATHPNAIDEAFHATPDPAPTWREFLGAYAALADQQWRPLQIPTWVAKPVATIADRIIQLRDEPIDTRGLVHFLTSQTTYSTAKARSLLHWQPTVSLGEGIQRCAPYLRDEGLLK